MSEASPAAAVGGGTTAERKVLTLLFVDLTGYTRLTATRDPEDVLVAVGPLLGDLRHVAEEHGGYVPSVQGDGFLAVFGAPTTHSDDPRRAVEAAVAMRTRVQSRRAAGEDVPDVHVGIASGEVLVSAHDGHHEVIGAPVNLAARLSDAASPGEVLVDEASAALTADDALYGAARGVTLAGFAGTVRALPLINVGRRPSSGALVGREEQLLALDRAFQAEQTSAASAALVVTGDAGAGKSRLVESWVQSARGALVLRGSCRPYGSPLPLSALSEAISRASDALAADLAALPGGPAALVDFLRLLPRERPATGPGREPDEALQVAARRLLTAVTRERTTVLVLEDLHWADESLVEMIHGLHNDPIAGGLMVIATSREPAGDLPTLDVPPLSSDDVARVVELRVGAPPASALLDLLVERSAGNPLWLVECLALLQDRGQLGVEGSHAVAWETAGEPEVPASIRLLVSARLDSLPAAHKAALQRISVWPTEVALADCDEEIAEISGLLATGLLERSANDLLRFSHGLVREAVYRSMPRAARVAEHERLLGGSPDPAVRAYSALEVHRLDVAPDHSRRRFIADRAVIAVVVHARHLRMSHTRAAKDVLLRAGDLVAELDAIVPKACAVLLTELAEVLSELEDGAGSRESASRAVALAALASDESTRINAQLALGHAMLGADNATARELAEQVLGLDEISEPHRARAWRLIAGSHVYDDFSKVAPCLEQAHRSYLTAGDGESAASTARQLAWNLSVTADAEFDRWLAVASAATEAGHVRGQGELQLVRAVVAEARGEWEEAWQSATSAISLTERVGMYQSLVTAVAVAVEAATFTGRRDALPGLLARLTSLMQGHRARLQITGLCAAAPALMLLGRAKEAEQALATAQSMLASVGPNEATMFWAATGHSAALADRHEDAEPAFAQAELLAQQLGHTLFGYGCRLQRFTAQTRGGGRVGLHDDLLALALDLDVARAEVLAEQARALAASLND
jgi:class 3 adenylate cyclase